MKRATITKRPYEYKGKTEDRWIVKWTDPTGTRREKSFPNKRHAEAHASKIDRDTERGIHEPSSGKITFGEVWKAWIAHCEHRRKIGDLAGNTLANYHWGADHILPEFGQRQIGKITSVDVEAWVHKKRETLARHSVHNFYSYLYLALNYAVRKKWIASNPLRDDPIKVPGRKQRRADIPSFEDVELLIQILHGPRPGWCQTISWENRKVAFALEAFAGLRVGEVAALRWDAIDMSGTTLRIVEGAGTASMIDGLKRPKSEAGIRSVPISQYLYDALVEHAQATDMKGFVIKPQQRGSQSTRAPRARETSADVYLSSQAISDMHHDLMVRSNLMKPDGTVKFTAHALRHWYASSLISIQTNVVAVSKRMGHSDASITTSVYAHVIEGTEDGLKNAVAPIWHERLARAEPGRVPMIDGVVVASETGPLIDGTATRLIETVIPQNAYPWVPEALRLLEGGWRVPDVTRHLGQSRTNINAAFHKLGLPTPDSIRVKVRDRKFGELLDAGHTDKEIAQRMNCSTGTVFHWRLTKEAGVPNTRTEFKKLMRKGSADSKRKLTDDQVREVLDRLDVGESFAKIAKRFSVTHGVIGNIKSGKNYGWVKRERGKNEGASDADKPLEYKEKQPITPDLIAEKMRESQLKLL